MIPSRALAFTLLLASAVLADQAHLPLPGLDTKPHLWHLKREDLALDALMASDVKGPVVNDGKEPVHFYQGDGPYTEA